MREYFLLTQGSKDSQDEFNQFLEIISQSLKIKVQNELYIERIMSNIVFSKVIGKQTKVQVKAKPKKFKLMSSKQMTTKFFNFFKAPAMRSSKILGNTRDMSKDKFMNMVVSKMGTLFSSPEEYIIKFG